MKFKNLKQTLTDSDLAVLLSLTQGIRNTMVDLKARADNNEDTAEACGITILMFTKHFAFLQDRVLDQSIELGELPGDKIIEFAREVAEEATNELVRRFVGVQAKAPVNFILNIAGNDIQLNEIRADVEAAKTKGIHYNEMAFTLATVQGLLDAFDQLQGSRDYRPRYLVGDRMLKAEDLWWYRSNLLAVSSVSGLSDKFDMAYLMGREILKIPQDAFAQSGMSDADFVEWMITGLYIHAKAMDAPITVAWSGQPQADKITTKGWVGGNKFLSKAESQDLSEDIMDSWDRAISVRSYGVSQPGTRLAAGKIVGTVYAPTIAIASAVRHLQRMFDDFQSREAGSSSEHSFYKLTGALLVVNDLLGLRTYDNNNVLGEIQKRLKVANDLLEERKGFKREPVTGS